MQSPLTERGVRSGCAAARTYVFPADLLDYYRGRNSPAAYHSNDPRRTRTPATAKNTVTSLSRKRARDALCLLRDRHGGFVFYEAHRKLPR